MQQHQHLSTGTTTVGIVCKDCVILGSESKSTMGSLVASKTSQKIYQVDDKIGITTAGGAGDTQMLMRIVKAEINLYKMGRNREMTIKAAAALLSNILSSNRYYPYMAMLIIGGADADGFHVVTMDPVGGSDDETYTSTGSGSPMAYGVLEDGYKDGLTKEEGMRLAVRAVRAARERDIFSGGKDIVIAVIDKNGFKLVDKQTVENLAK